MKILAIILFLSVSAIAKPIDLNRFMLNLIFWMIITFFSVYGFWCAMTDFIKSWKRQYHSVKTKYGKVHGK
jgi:hypothetical protein